MNDRPYLLLWFALAFFAILVVAGVYSHWRAPPPATQPTTQSLVERLREERQRRMHQDQPATTAATEATP